VNRKNPDPEDVRLAREGWTLAKEIISGRKADIVVLDEINCAMDFGLLPVGEVLEAIQGKPDGWNSSSRDAEPRRRLSRRRISSPRCARSGTITRRASTPAWA